MAEEKKPWPTTKRLKKRRPKTYDWETSEMYDPMIRRRILGQFNCEGKTKGQILIDLVDVYIGEAKGIKAVDFTSDLIKLLWPSGYIVITPTAEQVIQILEILKTKASSKRQIRLINLTIDYLKLFNPKEFVNYKNIDRDRIVIESYQVELLVKKLSKDECFSIVNLLTKVQLCKLYKYSTTEQRPDSPPVNGMDYTDDDYYIDEDGAWF